MAIQVHNGLTGSRFVNMCVANWFLHIYVFATIPLVAAQVAQLQESAHWVGWSVMLFAVGMVLPGPFGAHLMERRSRKEIFLKALLVLGPLATLGYVLATDIRLILAMQLLQGMAFGVSQTALGTTLVNDILLSKQRNKGDIIYGWAGRIGIPLGLFLGYVLSITISLQQSYWWALVPCAFSFVLVAQTTVPIKAPVKVSFVTFDRFFLPSSIPLGLSMFAAPWTLGRIAGMLPHSCNWLLSSAYVCLSLGVLFAFLMQIFIQRRVEQRKLMTLGYLTIIGGLMLISYPNVVLGNIGDILLGCGVGAVSSRHLMDWVTKSAHCQRGTAQNTYMICWRWAFSLGLLCTCFFELQNVWIDIALCAISLLLYVLWTHGKA